MLAESHFIRVDWIELDTRDRRLGSRRPVDLQPPILATLKVSRNHLSVFIGDLIWLRPRIPYAQLSVFVYKNHETQTLSSRPL